VRRLRRRLLLRRDRRIFAFDNRACSERVDPGL
jgi:hypothetical protein